MSQLDTPPNSSDATSLYDDALDARRGANFEPPAFLFLWTIFLVIDCNDRLLELCSWTVPSVIIPWGVELSACIFQFLIAFSALCLCLASVMCSARILYYIARGQLYLFLLSIYIILVYSLSITDTRPANTVVAILARLSTAVSRFQLLLLPLLITGRFARTTSVRVRARFTSIPPVIAGGCVLTISLYTLFTVPQESSRIIIYDLPSAAGRFPLFTFFAGLVLTFWSIAGLFIICSQTANLAVRAYVYSGVFIFVFSVANFCIVQPALALSQGFGNISFAPDLSSGFLGTSSPCALIPLLFACIVPSPFLLAVHWEEERQKSQTPALNKKCRHEKGYNKRKGNVISIWRKSLAKQLEHLLPKIPDYIPPTASISARSASIVNSHSTVARYIYNPDDEEAIVDDGSYSMNAGIVKDENEEESLGDICVPARVARRIVDAHEDEGFDGIRANSFEDGGEYDEYGCNNGAENV